ncbi:hypothetical protein ACFOY8_14440 [Thalassospira xianhensis]|uniref:Uncharacterized protein n=1 Tax=Thalassospira xianhensis MCCC 1A02616 TaxID=1177929 RepID=A0A367UHK7_9PROT|nr:hypothetical protein [Thalassospira xianhensis]RCK07649.1 hypothetical protein TH5_00810 [Thalassospira xianhensis MCCC 1A02616]
MANFEVRVRVRDDGTTGVTIGQGADDPEYCLDAEALADLADGIRAAQRKLLNRKLADDLPNVDFMAKLVAEPPYNFTSCRKLFAAPEVDDTVFASTPLASMNWMTLFAYMHRRFGPPYVQTSGHQDISAGWRLSSPEPDLVVDIVPCAGEGIENCFEPYFDGTIEKEEGKPDTALHGRLSKAYRAVLMDLLRPVGIREHSFIEDLLQTESDPEHSMNALGPLWNQSRLHEGQEVGEGQFAYYQVAHHPSCGVATPIGLLDSDEWRKFISFITTLGEDDALKGLDIACNHAIEKTAQHHVRKASWPVLRLVLLSARPGGFQEDIKRLLALSPADEAIFQDDLLQLGIGNQKAQSILEEFTRDVIDEAEKLGNLLGYPRLYPRWTVRNLENKQWLLERLKQT